MIDYNLIHQKILRLFKIERRVTGKIIEHLIEIEHAKAYIEWGYSGIYDYLTRGIGYSESAAYQRKTAVKLAVDMPEINQKLEDRTLTFTNLTQAYKIIKKKPLAEKRQVLLSLENKTKTQAEKILATYDPLKNFAAKKRYVSESHIELKIYLKEEDMQILDQLKSLKAHADITYEDIVSGLLQQEWQKQKNIKLTTKPSSKNARQIKPSIKKYLLQKSNYQCQYPGCKETHFLQVDHIQPVSRGGTNSLQNLQILCATHNQWKSTR